MRWAGVGGTYGTQVAVGPAGLEEAGDELGVRAVGLGAQQFAGAIGPDPGRVDDVDGDAVLDQEVRQGFVIDAGRFQADGGRRGMPEAPSQ